MANKRTTVVIAGIMLSLFMSAIEATVVATAMPTIVSQLGGLAAYSWVFSAYMLTSTTTVPLYGKLSDLYGRRPLFFIAMTLFLLGSILCGMSQSMEQLIVFRALQGLGAGGLIPLAFIIIGDILPFAQRARMQGLFSGVWGVASIAGPLLGGFLVDQLSWRWVFYVNIIPGLLAIALVGIALRDRCAPRSSQAVGRLRRRDPADGGCGGAAAGIVRAGHPHGLDAAGPALILFAALFWVERRAVDPVLPLPLFRDRLFAVAIAQGVLSGWAMFGSTNFVPLFGQGVLGLSATAAGTALTPMMLSWTAASILGGRLLLRYSYRALALVGGLAWLRRIPDDPNDHVHLTRLSDAVPRCDGGRHGIVVPAFLIAVQSSVQRAKLGTATATLQFSRSIGGTLGVSVMGVILTAQLAANLAAAGISTATVSLGALIDPGKHGAASTALDTAVRTALAAALDSVFVAAFIAAALALAVTFLTPHGHIAEQAALIAASQPEATSKS